MSKKICFWYTWLPISHNIFSLSHIFSVVPSSTKYFAFLPVFKFHPFHRGGPKIAEGMKHWFMRYFRVYVFTQNSYMLNHSVNHHLRDSFDFMISKNIKYERNFKKKKMKKKSYRWWWNIVLYAVYLWCVTINLFTLNIFVFRSFFWSVSCSRAFLHV